MCSAIAFFDDPISVIAVFVIADVFIVDLIVVVFAFDVYGTIGFVVSVPAVGMAVLLAHLVVVVFIFSVIRVATFISFVVANISIIDTVVGLTVSLVFT